jgi:hypothetical protein
VIIEPDNQPSENRTDKFSGAFGRTALAATVAELLIYWLLVIRLPAVMAVVSIVLGGAAWYFRRAQSYLAALQEEMQLSGRDLALVDRYCKSWIYISAYGAAFCLFLLLKG